MRRNRFDPEDDMHVAVHTKPAAYTRASRRAAGHRGGVHVQAMRDFHSAQVTLPRAVRRLMRDPLKAEQRINGNRAKVNRLIAPYGAHL